MLTGAIPLTLTLFLKMKAATMHPDPTDCDYGVGFYGHAINSGAVIVNGSSVGSGSSGSSGSMGGVTCWFCNLAPSTRRGSAGRSTGGITFAWKAVMTDAFKKRVYVGSAGLDLQIEAGLLASVEGGVTSTSTSAGTGVDNLLLISVAADAALAVFQVGVVARVRVEQVASAASRERVVVHAYIANADGSPTTGVALPLVRGAYEVPATEVSHMLLKW